MGGFVIDSVVVSIVRAVRRQKRHNQALRWSIAEGKFTRFTTSAGSSTLPLLDYAFEVAGRTHDGSATGFKIEDDQINPIGDVIDSLSSVRVRYDPSNPDRNRILNEDNPQIPFEIDHLEH